MLRTCTGKQGPCRTATLLGALGWGVSGRPPMPISRSCTRLRWEAGATSPSRTRRSFRPYQAPARRGAARTGSRARPARSRRGSSNRFASAPPAVQGAALGSARRVCSMPWQRTQGRQRRDPTGCPDGGNVQSMKSVEFPETLTDLLQAVPSGLRSDFITLARQLSSDDWHLQGYGQLGGRMSGFQGLNQTRGQQQGGQLEPQLPDTRQQGFAPASQNMAMLSGFQVPLIL